MSTHFVASLSNKRLPTDYIMLAILAFLSVLLSWITTLYGNPFNVDGLLYLDAAKAFSTQGWHAAYALFKWPFYSILIAWVSQVSSLSLEHSARVIDVFLQVGIVWGFVLVVQELNADRLQRRLASCVILSFPFLNHMRADLMRDFGYEAFLLFALLMLLRYIRIHSWWHAIGFVVLMVLATAFRIEGAIFLLFGPMCLLGYRDPVHMRQRGWLIMRLYFVMVLPLLGSLWWHHTHQITSATEMLGRLPEVLIQIKEGVMLSIHNIHEKSVLLQQSLLDANSKESALWIIVGGALTVWCVNLLHVITPLFLLVALYGMRQHLMPVQSGIYHVLVGFILINVVVLLGFVTQHLFVDKRYFVGLALLIMLWVPFGISDILKRHYSRVGGWKKLIWPLMLVYWIAMTIGGVVRFGPSKAYITESGMWLHTHTPITARVYSNDRSVLYYADRPPAADQPIRLADTDIRILSNHIWNNFDYLAIRFQHDDPTLVKTINSTLNMKPVQIFQNRRGDRVEIYTK